MHGSKPYFKAHAFRGSCSSKIIELQRVGGGYEGRETIVDLQKVDTLDYDTA